MSSSLRLLRDSCGLAFNEFHRLFVDRESDAITFTGDLVPGSRRINSETPGLVSVVFILLRPGQDKDVFVTNVLVKRDFTAGPIAQECRRWARNSVPIKTKNLYVVPILYPRNLVLMLSDMKEITAFIGEQTASWLRVHAIAAMKDLESATAPNTPPCIFIILRAAK